MTGQVLTPIGMNASGQQCIANTGDTLSGLSTVAYSGSYTDLTSKPVNVSTFINDAGYITSSALSGYVTSSSLTTTLGNYTTSGALTTLLASYVTNTSLSTTLAGYATTSSVPAVYFGTTKQTAPKFYANSFTITTAGTAVFNLTSDGTPTGAALMTLPNIASMNVLVNDSTAQYQASGALSNSNKTLTITINRAGFLNVALLGLTILATPVSAPIGTVVNVQIWGQ